MYLTFSTFPFVDQFYTLKERLMFAISMKKNITHQKTIYACHRLRISDRTG